MTAAAFVISSASYTPNPDFTIGEAVGSASIAIAEHDIVTTAAITLDDCTAVAQATFTAISHGVAVVISGTYTPLADFVIGVADLSPNAIATITLDSVVINSDIACHLPPLVATAAIILDDIASNATVVVIDNSATASIMLSDAVANAKASYLVNVMRWDNANVLAINNNANSIIVDMLSSPSRCNNYVNQVLAIANTTVAFDNSIIAMPTNTETITNDLTVIDNNAIGLLDSTYVINATVDHLNRSLTAIDNNADTISVDTSSIQPVLVTRLNQLLSNQIECVQRHYRLVDKITSIDTRQYYPFPVFIFDTPTAPAPIPIFNFNSVPVIELADSDNAGIYSKDFAIHQSQPIYTVKELSAINTIATPPTIGVSQHIDLPRPPPATSVVTTANGGIALVIPTLENYAMQHTISAKIVATNAAVKLDRISLSYDVDMFAWNFSGVLASKEDLALFNMASLDPIELQITIDGYVWLVIVEKIPERKSFGKTEITLTGRSLSALLGAPWILPASFTAGSDMTIQQLANALLPIDWTINWQCPTWIVPAGTYSYTQQTKIQALKALADNIGAILKPARDSKTIDVIPRYPVTPWNYNATGIAPDLTIPDSAIESVGIESRMTSPINGVYVHGGDNGVLAFCRLNGTAGDVLAPTETNVLITDQQAARMLGERILAGRATPPVTSSVTTFLGGDFPLADVGMLVAVNGERAIINGVSIDVDFSKVRQIITLGDQTSNIYAKLIALMPQYPLLVGRLVSTSGDISVLTLLDGGVITARGTGTVGNNYYVRNGFIETAAPNLTQVEIVI